MQEYLEKPLFNILGIVLLSIACFFIYGNSGVLAGTGMAALVLMWLPVLLGLFTIVVYLISRIFTKNKNWIATIIGAVLMLILTISGFF